MKLEKLKALAKAATPGPWDYDGGYILKGVCCDSPRLAKCFSDGETNFPWLDNAEYITAANPATILEMIELIRMMKEALDSLYINDYSGYEVSKHEAHLIDEALAAVKRWEKGESE